MSGLKYEMRSFTWHSPSIYVTWLQEHFAQHCDGMYTNDDGECSIYSLVLYLNDEFEGAMIETSAKV